MKSLSTGWDSLVEELKSLQMKYNIAQYENPEDDNTKEERRSVLSQIIEKVRDAKVVDSIKESTREVIDVTKNLDDPRHIGSSSVIERLDCSLIEDIKKINGMKMDDESKKKDIDSLLNSRLGTCFDIIKAYNTVKEQLSTGAINASSDCYLFDGIEPMMYMSKGRLEEGHQQPFLGNSSSTHISIHASLRNLSSELSLSRSKRLFRKKKHLETAFDAAKRHIDAMLETFDRKGSDIHGYIVREIESYTGGRKRKRPSVRSLLSIDPRFEHTKRKGEVKHQDLMDNIPSKIRQAIDDYVTLLCP